MSWKHRPTDAPRRRATDCSDIRDIVEEGPGEPKRARHYILDFARVDLRRSNGADRLSARAENESGDCGMGKKLTTGSAAIERYIVRHFKKKNVVIPKSLPREIVRAARDSVRMEADKALRPRLKKGTRLQNG